SCPGLNVCGGSLPGVPGVIIGRNEQVAWGLTNLMTDCCDLFIVDLDPGNPARYKVKGVYHDMKKETGVIKIAGGKEREVTTWHTMYGPVITELSPGVEAAAAMCWYGTHSSAGDPDTTLRAVFAMDKARNTEDMVAAAKLLQTVGMNVVEADTGGSIAWFASGRIPRRRGYSGRLPADGSTGGCSWEGFVPPDENPSAINPASGFIATANHKTAPAGYPHKVTHSWAAPYRHRRIVELLGREKAHSPDSFAAIQKDVYSKRAEVFLPVLLGFSYAGKEAREAAGMLKDWDLSMGADSRGGLLFQVFLNRFAEILCKDLLGEYLPVYTIFSHLFFSALDALFDSAAGGRVPGKKQRQLLGGRDLAALCEEALGGSIRFIEKALGRNRKTWSWGRLHRYYYRHPGARGGLAERLLNRGPYPAPGSTDTINLGFYNPAKKGPPANQFEVTAIPSLRFLTDLADADSSRIMGPMGQSGRPGTLHYADMMKHWMKVEYVSLPLSREKSVEISVQKTVLEP
ncbi:MAG: penicillin acylase family protein, partial [Spirochaetales bacterium]